MMKSNRSLLPLLLAVVAIVLLNAAGSTLFIRRDLTNNRAYSLSAASKTTVSELKEPLTIKIFFSPNLPADVIGRRVRLAPIGLPEPFR